MSQKNVIYTKSKLQRIKNENFTQISMDCSDSSSQKIKRAKDEI